MVNHLEFMDSNIRKVTFFLNANQGGALMDGKIVTDVSVIRPETVLTTLMQGGEVTSKVLKVDDRRSGE